MFLKKNSPNKRNKKAASMLFEVLVLIIFSLLFIFALYKLGESITKIFHPDLDKTTVEKFNQMARMIETMANDASKPSDAKRFTLYLANSHQIIFFSAGSDMYSEEYRLSLAGGWGQTLLKPTKCLDKTKNCLCLYRNTWIKAQDRDITCKNYLNTFSVGDVDLNEKNTNFRKDGNYFSIIIAKDTVNTNRVIHLWEDNEENRKKEAILLAPHCKPTDGVCANKLDGTLITGPANYKNVFTACRAISSTYNSIEATCVYDPDTQKCTLDCKKTSIDCSQVKTCEDYSKILGWGTPGSMTYFTKDSVPYNLCKKDNSNTYNDICKVSNGKGCNVKSFEHYACIDSSSTTGLQSALKNSKCYIPCAEVKYYDFDSLKGLVKSYDDSKCTAAEKNTISTNFKLYTDIYICKGVTQTQNDALSAACNQFIIDQKSGCNLKVISGPFNNYLIDYATQSCTTEPNKIPLKFEPVYYCASPEYDYEIIDINLDPAQVNTGTGTNKPCKLTSLANQNPRIYNCVKNTNLGVIMKIKNTGKEVYALKIQATPKVFIDGLESNFLGATSNIPKGTTQPLSSQVRLDNRAAVKYEIIAEAICTDTVCTNNEYLASRDLTTDAGKIVVNTVDIIS